MLRILKAHMMNIGRSYNMKEKIRIRVKNNEVETAELNATLKLGSVEIPVYKVDKLKVHKLSTFGGETNDTINNKE